MRLLLDTHVLLWAQARERRLGRSIREAIEDESNEIFVSIASVWEMVIKSAAGRLDLVKPIDDLMEEAVAVSGMRLLPIGLRHALRVADLPQHHRDPFDRMLVAQALEEGLTLVSGDAVMRRYPAALMDPSQ